MKKMEKNVGKEPMAPNTKVVNFCGKVLLKKREKTQLETITYHFFRPETAM